MTKKHVAPGKLKPSSPLKFSVEVRNCRLVVITETTWTPGATLRLVQATLARWRVWRCEVQAAGAGWKSLVVVRVSGFSFILQPKNSF